MIESDNESIEEAMVHEDPEYEIEGSSVKDLPGEIKELLKSITKDYSLTYAEVKGHPDLSAPPLSGVDVELIKRHIRLSRDAIRRAHAKSLVSSGAGLVNPLVGMKRTQQKA